jgi:hypothetical protein
LALKFQEGWFPLLLFEPPSTWEKSNPAERRKKERKKEETLSSVTAHSTAWTNT